MIFLFTLLAAFNIMISKVVAGTKTKKVDAYKSLADFINISLGYFLPQDMWDAAKAKSRYESLLGNYKRVKSMVLDKTGGKFCITEEELLKGITLAQKLRSLCPHFIRWDYLYGQKSNVTPAFTMQGGDEVTAFTNQDGDDVTAYTMQEEEMENASDDDTYDVHNVQASDMDDYYDEDVETRYTSSSDNLVVSTTATIPMSSQLNAGVAMPLPSTNALTPMPSQMLPLQNPNRLNAAMPLLPTNVIIPMSPQIMLSLQNPNRPNAVLPLPTTNALTPMPSRVMLLILKKTLFIKIKSTFKFPKKTND